MRRRGGGPAWVAIVLFAAGCSGGSAAAPSPVPTTTAPPSTAAPSQSAAPSRTAVPSEQTAVTIGWSGDAVPASVDSGLPPDPARLLAGVTPLTRAPDVMIGNLEGTLTDHAGDSKCRPGRTDCVAFRAPPAYASLFARAGYDVLSLANNHAHDHGEAGLAQTRQVVRAAGMATTGGPAEVAVRTVRGVRVAVVGFAPYGWAAPLNDPAAERALVARAAAQADIVVVVFHGGAEGSGALHVPTGRETAFGEDRGDLRAFARIAVAAGADAVLGAGPHVVRGAEVVGGRPVAYSAGNLVGYRALSTAGVTATTAILQLTIRADGSWAGGVLHATHQVPPGYAETDPARTAIALVARLSREDFGRTAVRIDPNGSLRPPA
ncbi:MAG TPA: CapA family protein [Mycobacteriales bacterium]|nr:CapA family protein [Mycobacteriales bacterium]